MFPSALKRGRMENAVKHGASELLSATVEILLW